MIKNILIAVAFMIAGCFLFAEHTFAQYYDDQDRSVNSAGGNIYGDSRFSMEANPNSNMRANPNSNINANPDTYINDNPNFPSNIHNPSDGWNGQGQ
tara:strand:+ start:353 stop:643 length:291 start_codon:yes stop_codon:yes gene_type:complete